jgi:hypothetical protein
MGATLAALFLHVVINVSASYGSNYPASGYSASDAFLMEAVLTLGLVSVILGTASGAQNIGIIGAIGVGAYIALAGLWGSPISGASMNPAHVRPELSRNRLHGLLGLCRRPTRGCSSRSGCGMGAPRCRRRPRRLRRRPGRPLHRDQAPR